MGKYFKNNFYPQNFILLTTAENKYQAVDEIVNEAVLTVPEKFNGRRKSFPFELRYVPPFDKNFRELKRLQGTAAEMAGFPPQIKKHYADAQCHKNPILKLPTPALSESG